VKCKPVPELTLALRHEAVLGECRYSSKYYLTSVLDGGEWSALTPVPTFTNKISYASPSDHNVDTAKC